MYALIEGMTELDKNIFGNVQEAIADSLDIGRDEVAIDKKISDFPNWDSLGFVKVIVSLSERFGKDLDVVTLVNYKTIREIYDHIVSISS